MNGISFGTPTGKPHDLRDTHCELRDTKTITGQPYYEMALVGCGCGMSTMVALARAPEIALRTAITESLYRSHRDKPKPTVEPPKSNREKFIVSYAVNLGKAVEQFPDVYHFPVENVPVVVEKMVAAIDKGSFIKDSHGIRWTCKELGIKHTYKAIAEFWKG